MTSPSQSTSSRSKLAATLRKLDKYRRQREAEQALHRIDTEVLTVEGLADYLHCSIGNARALVKDRVPTRDSGRKRLIVLKEDVLRFLRQSERSRRGITPEMVREAESAVLTSTTDSERKRSRKEIRK